MNCIYTEAIKDASNTVTMDFKKIFDSKIHLVTT